MKDLDRLFADHQRGGRVTMLYETEIYFGTIEV
jgi:hypothetical protein